MDLWLRLQTSLQPTAGPSISTVAIRLPKRRAPSKPNGARLRPASHYGEALRAFDRPLIPPWSAFGTEIAMSAASERKDRT